MPVSVFDLYIYQVVGLLTDREYDKVIELVNTSEQNIHKLLQQSQAVVEEILSAKESLNQIRTRSEIILSSMKGPLEISWVWCVCITCVLVFVLPIFFGRSNCEATTGIGPDPDAVESIDSPRVSSNPNTSPDNSNLGSDSSAVSPWRRHGHDDTPHPFASPIHPDRFLAGINPFSNRPNLSARDNTFHSSPSPSPRHGFDMNNSSLNPILVTSPASGSGNRADTHPGSINPNSNNIESAPSSSVVNPDPDESSQDPGSSVSASGSESFYKRGHGSDYSFYNSEGRYSIHLYHPPPIPRPINMESAPSNSVVNPDPDEFIQDPDNSPPASDSDISGDLSLDSSPTHVTSRHRRWIPPFRNLFTSQTSPLNITKHVMEKRGEIPVDPDDCIQDPDSPTPASGFDNRANTSHRHSRNLPGSSRKS